MASQELESGTHWPLRWELLLRYRYIEIIALWEGRLTTRHLCESFGIGRQQASKDINTYLREVGPGNLIYDKHLKGYKPATDFNPVVTQGQADEYLLLMARNNELNGVFESLTLQSTNVELLNIPVRDVHPAVVRAIVLAARQQRRMEVDYVSLHSPDREGRIIVPHTLVHTGLRWHVRAWCEKNQDFRDFVLSRFRGIPELMDSSEKGQLQDHEWNEEVSIVIKADPRLEPQQREVVEHDYGMEAGNLTLTVRAKLVPYALQALHLDTKIIDMNPLAQQIVVDNIEELRAWLFH